MNVNNDCFGYMLQFLDLKSIGRLAMTCKSYNLLCKRFVSYDKMLRYISDKSDYRNHFIHLNESYYISIGYPYNVFYKMLVDKYFDIKILEYCKKLPDRSNIPHIEIKVIIACESNIIDKSTFIKITDFFEIEKYSIVPISANHPSYFSMYVLVGLFNKEFADLLKN